MEILIAAINKLKCKFSDEMEENLCVENYGISSCDEDGIKICGSLKLRIIFLENIKYLCLSVSQLNQIENGDYRVCCIKKNHC